MNIQEFDFHLPEELIAHKPVEPRDTSRLLHVSKQQETPQDLLFSDLIDLLNPDDIMVFNDTKVIAARLRGTRIITAENDLRESSKIEITLHKKTTQNSWQAFAKPAKKLRIGDVINFHKGADKQATDLTAQVIAKNDGGEVGLQFNQTANDLEIAINDIGEIPLPPYIMSKRDVDKNDIENYQTIFAKELGAVAAPTAGLHYTKEIFDALNAKGIAQEYLTLHVGAGTFLPVKVDDTNDHKMHYEYYTISEQTAKNINKAKENGGRVIAIGTTSLRALESATDENGILQSGSQDTDIFITPGYKFKIVDALQTNFHIPKSTLFMLVSAFSGTEKMKQSYAHAIKNQYRFYSYGDTCFLE